jgi:hypothetical protein
MKALPRAKMKPLLDGWLLIDFHGDRLGQIIPNFPAPKDEHAPDLLD